MIDVIVSRPLEVTDGWDDERFSVWTIPNVGDRLVLGGDYVTEPPGYWRVIDVIHHARPIGSPQPLPPPRIKLERVCR